MVLHAQETDESLMIKVGVLLNHAVWSPECLCCDTARPDERTAMHAVGQDESFFTGTFAFQYGDGRESRGFRSGCCT